MKKLYLFAKQIHRLLIILITGLGAVMAGTGLMLKYPSRAVRFLPGLDLGLVRFIHSTLSTAFAIVLALMMLTGLVMYLVPWMQKRRAQIASTKEAIIKPTEN